MSDIDDLMTCLYTENQNSELNLRLILSNSFDLLLEKSELDEYTFLLAAAERAYHSAHAREMLNVLLDLLAEAKGASSNLSNILDEQSPRTGATALHMLVGHDAHHGGRDINGFFQEARKLIKLGASTDILNDFGVNAVQSAERVYGILMEQRLGIPPSRNPLTLNLFMN